MSREFSLPSLLRSSTSYVPSVSLTVITDVTNVIRPVSFPYRHYWCHQRHMSRQFSLPSLLMSPTSYVPSVVNTDVTNVICPVSFTYRHYWCHQRHKSCQFSFTSVLMSPMSYVPSVVNTDVTNVICPVSFPYRQYRCHQHHMSRRFSLPSCWLLWNVWRQCCMFCHIFPCYDYYVILQTLHINVGSLVIRPAIFPALFICHQCHMSRRFTSLMSYVPPLYVTHVICPAVRHQCHISGHCTSPIYRRHHYTAPV